ncbi:MAG: hypothetical protein F6K54_28175 [Okeania sp. SIO3B5]|uniref:hypothetical protein n=1 Tax=Okeania sp. SIO3B5 TaxID=2607811 RepID=UPI0013FF6741|nr:hypothetical protein [Okeania sp. SIO3B5]NEO56612.1 hypothetical protein [Okeania sp. SIO3B5]
MESQTIDPCSLLGKTLDSIWPIYFPLLVISSPTYLINIASITLLLPSSPSISVILLIIGGLTYPLLFGTQVLYIHRYFTQTSGIREIISQLLEKFVLLILTQIIVYLIVFFGMILLLFPGFYMSVRLFFSLYGTVLESETDGISSSWELTKGHWWSIFFALLSVGFIIAIVSWVLSLFLDPILSGIVSSSSIQQENLLIIQQFFRNFLMHPFAVVYGYLLYMELKEINELNKWYKENN